MLAILDYSVFYLHNLIINNILFALLHSSDFLNNNYSQLYAVKIRLLQYFAYPAYQRRDIVISKSVPVKTVCVVEHSCNTLYIFYTRYLVSNEIRFMRCFIYVCANIYA